MANKKPGLSDLIRDRMREAPQQQVPWADVMRMALYEPGLGYYRCGVRRIGRGGDFFTSVSAGPLFGRLLAVFAHQVWVSMEKPAGFMLIEQGAHDGTLARDVLEGCRAVSAEFFDTVEYGIIEPDETLRAAQLATLGGGLVTKLRPHESSVPARPSLFLCNELLDAFPVHRVRWTGDAWRELWVREDATAPGGFAFVEGELSDVKLHSILCAQGTDLPAGYTTEICLEADAWLASLAESPFTGAVLMLDYGFTTHEHFAPERMDGTLRRYLAHRMDDRVLENLGDADLTAHVDFTRLAQTAEFAGMHVAEFIEQGRFLSRVFAGTFSSQGAAPDAATVRQFHTLTHPNHMGRSFHAMVLAKGLPASVVTSPASTTAARHRLGLAEHSIS